MDRDPERPDFRLTVTIMAEFFQVPRELLLEYGTGTYSFLKKAATSEREEPAKSRR